MQKPTDPDIPNQMTTLTLQEGQSVMLGDDIEVAVTDVLEKRARIGVEAPRTISIHRKEVYEAIKNKQ